MNRAVNTILIARILIFLKGMVLKFDNKFPFRKKIQEYR